MSISDISRQTGQAIIVLLKSSEDGEHNSRPVIIIHLPKSNRVMGHIYPSRRSPSPRVERIERTSCTLLPLRHYSRV